MPKSEKFQQLPAPWDRIFSLGTRTFVWGLLIAIIYLLRPFFLLIFLTFVFAYIQSHGVDGLKHRFKNRAYRVTLVFIVFLGLIVGTGYFLASPVQQQMTEFTKNYPSYMKQADSTIYKWLESFPELKAALTGSKIKEKDESDEGKPGDGGKENPKGAQKTETPKNPDEKEQEAGKIGAESQDPDQPAIVEPLVRQLLGISGATNDGAAPDKKDISGYMNTLKGTAAGILGVTSSFLLAILFSFLIVLDLPKLTKATRGLAETRLDFIYAEVVDNIHHFGTRLGRALEAQLFIAICNTILTAIGISLLGLDSIVFLSTIVFFCSFIPVAGVFISSAPICLLALQAGDANTSGIEMMVWAIVLILVIHTVEAYLLNPKIYGHHLRMNAVLVLIVLTIAGKLVGVWGLVLGLPVVNYFFTTAIRRDDEVSGDTAKVPITKPAAAEKDSGAPA